MEQRQSMNHQDPGAAQRAVEEPISRRTRATLPISGLICGGGGALTLERAIQALPGVIRVYVNPATEMAYVEYWPAEVRLDELVDVIEKMGYETVRPEERS